MVGGFGSVLTLYVEGWLGVGKAGLEGWAADPFQPVYLLGLDPLIYGLIASFGLGIVVSLCTPPMPRSEVDRYFLEEKEAGESEKGSPAA
jgi:hypothetical protein